MSGYTVGQAARLAGVTVRTLHHYDRIGLLTPSGRTASGYRSYDDADLLRLWRIRVYRELEVPLDEIATLLDGAVDPDRHLRDQHARLVDQRDRLARIIATLERLQEARRMGINLTPDEMFEVFGDVDVGGYADEAESRWGDSEPWQQSQQRTASYGKAEWLAIRDEAADLEARFRQAFDGGLAPDSAVAMDLAEEHRSHLSRWFYDCGYDLHRGLAELYVTDPRFAAHYDDRVPGLASFVHDAIVANADRAAS